jgi:cytosine permease
VPWLFYPVCVIWALGAAFVGLKGIQYVAKVATWLPLIPLAVLLLGLLMFGFSAGSYSPPVAKSDNMGAILAMVAAIVGFFATAGAAGVDFGTNSRDKKDVSMGGLVGILAAILLTAGIAAVATAGAHASGTLGAADGFMMTTALQKKLPGVLYAVIMIGLPIAAFPGACFSSFIAANSFKTVMPKANPFVTVGIGAIVSMILALTGWAGRLGDVFGLIGASFGPICGAMVVDWYLAGKKWSGPRAGFNPAGWIAWAVGFIVGILPNGLLPEAIRVNVPAAPVVAFVVGAVVYFACAKGNMLSQILPYGPAAKKPEASPAQ